MNKSTRARYGRRSGTNPGGDVQRKEKFDFETMKTAALHKDRVVRKAAFVDYFERFAEFPSYLFDNEGKIDDQLYETAQDLLKDSETTKEMRDGIGALLDRLPS